MRADRWRFGVVAWRKTKGQPRSERACRDARRFILRVRSVVDPRRWTMAWEVAVPRGALSLSPPLWSLGHVQPNFVRTGPQVQKQK